MAKRLNSWEVSDELWKRVAPLIPEKKREEGKEYKRKPGGGRKPADPRKVFEAIVFVLRTGIQWKALPKEAFGVCPSSVHSYFSQWAKEGFFEQVWENGLAEYDELEGILWQWQSIDGAMHKAPTGGEATGPNPTDRGKKRKQTQLVGGRAWRPALCYCGRG
jgi:transposase